MLKRMVLGRSFLVRTVAVLVGVCLLLGTFLVRLQPLLTKLSESKAESVTLKIIHEQVNVFLQSQTISYDSLGQLNDFYQKPYRIYLNEGKDYVNGEWSIYSNIENDPYCPLMTNGKLSPINFYVENSMKALCVVGRINSQSVWSQPIYVYQNKYPSSIVNDWNGKLKIDNANNAILAAKVIAGKKHEDNTFSGIMMGDWTDKNDDLNFNPESE